MRSKDSNTEKVIEQEPQVSLGTNVILPPKNQGEYYHTENGFLYRRTKDSFKDSSKDKLISEAYIKVVGDIRDEDSRNWATQIEFKNMDNQLRTTEISNDILLDSKEILRELARNGFSKVLCTRDVAEYLERCSSDTRLLKVKRCGWVGNDKYICPSFTVLTDKKCNEQLILSNNVNDYGFRQQGTLKDWQENVCRYCENNHILTFALCVAISGILLKFFPNINSTMINLYGRSSIGKTTVLQVVASIWGPPRKYIQQWRTTSNGLEGLAEAHNDGLLVLDELSQLSSKDFGNIAYMLGNEKGKARMRADSSMRQSKEWRLSILSSGEEAVAEKIEREDAKAREGQLIRCIDIDCQVDDNFGIYNDIHKFSSSAELSNHLKDQCSKFYGRVSEEFVTNLVNTEDLTNGNLYSIYGDKKRNIYDKSNLSDADGPVKRFADCAALFATAGELASIDQYGIFTHNAAGVEESIHYVFGRWLNERGGKNCNHEEKIVAHIIDFLMQHDAMFKDVDNKYVDNKKDVFNCLGYKELHGSETIYWVNPSMFNNEICREIGYSSKIVKNALKKQKIYETYDDGTDKKCQFESRRRMMKLCMPHS
jgi:putative DNA primase/helicase